MADGTKRICAENLPGTIEKYGLEQKRNDHAAIFRASAPSVQKRYGIFWRILAEIQNSIPP